MAPRHLRLPATVLFLWADLEVGQAMTATRGFLATVEPCEVAHLLAKESQSSFYGPNRCYSECEGCLDNGTRLYARSDIPAISVQAVTAIIEDEQAQWGISTRSDLERKVAQCALDAMQDRIEAAT